MARDPRHETVKAKIARKRRDRDKLLERQNRDLAELARQARDEGYPMREIADALGMARVNAYAFMDRWAPAKDVSAAE